MNVRLIYGIALGIILGVAIGIGAYTFAYAKGWSYLTDDPAACANCHVMRDHLDAYVKSSHRSVATCNDCHTPPGLVPKYLTKAEHGFFHSLAFTTGDFHDPIQIKERSRRVTENSCRKCHSDIVRDIDWPKALPMRLPTMFSGAMGSQSEARQIWGFFPGK